MVKADPRAALDALIRERGEDYAGLSRLIGRNPAYIQQFIKRGTPRRLAEEDRSTLARYFGVAEDVFGGPPPAKAPVVAPSHAGGARRAADFVAVPRLAVAASAGPGALVGEEGARDRFAFDSAWLRGLAAGGPAGLSMIRVTGDSMAPTLEDGDDILVDRGDAAAGLRDGIYVLRMDDGLLVKRLLLQPADARITIVSDNPAYRDLPDCDPARIAVVGRVVWGGRRFR
jgi:phage repressor protein C with HTH and peptisase S24 domain